MTGVDGGDTGENVQRRSQPIARGNRIPEACSSLVGGSKKAWSSEGKPEGAN